MSDNVIYNSNKIAVKNTYYNKDFLRTPHAIIKFKNSDIKCQGSKKHRMVLINRNSNDGSTIKIRCQTMDCFKNIKRKYSFQFGLLCLRKNSYTLDQINTFFTSNKNDCFKVSHAACFSYYDWKAIIDGIGINNNNLHCICVGFYNDIGYFTSQLAGQYVCQIYQSTSNTNECRREIVNNNFQIKTSDVISVKIQRSSNKKVLFFKNNEKIVGMNIDWNMKEFDYFYALSSMCCDCGVKFGNMEFDVWYE